MRISGQSDLAVKLSAKANAALYTSYTAKRRIPMFTTAQSSLQQSLRWLRRIMTVILILSNFATVMLADAAPAVADTQPSFPIRAAFYYPWFPEAWNQQGFNPFTNYTPTLGFYDGGNQTVNKQQIGAMQYAGNQAET